MKKLYLLFCLAFVTSVNAQPYHNEWIKFSSTQQYSLQQYFKISIWKEGIYRLTYTDLDNALVPVNGIWTNPANDLLYIAHEQDELPGTPNAGQTCCTSFDVSDPLSPHFIAQIPLGALKLPSGELRNKKSINLVYVRPGYKGQTA